MTIRVRGRKYELLDECLFCCHGDGGGGGGKATAEFEIRNHFGDDEEMTQFSVHFNK